MKIESEKIDWKDVKIDRKYLGRFKILRNTKWTLTKFVRLVSIEVGRVELNTDKGREGRKPMLLR